jgi:peptidoglycan/LPS O-acetylase OafA/YrhL
LTNISGLWESENILILNEKTSGSFLQQVIQMMNKYKNISFFEGLNALRFFAALLVVMHHSETIRGKNGLYNLEWLGAFRNGGNAVTFFFVLSGFLITYLLLKENYNKGTVSIRRFYIKRTLRIWPLYFLLVIIGTLILPQIFSLLNINYTMPYTFGQVWYYFVFFFPGLVTFYFGNHFLEPLWSIGVEEIFYLMWAPLFKFCKKNILAILFLIMALKIILMIVSHFLMKEGLYTFLVSIFSFEAMAIGGLGAYFVFNRQGSFSNFFLYKKPVQLIIYLVLASYLLFHSNINNVVWNSIFKVPVFSKILVDFMFLYLIVGVSIIDNSIIKLRNKSLSFLGEISYGIYMYHILVIYTLIQFMKQFLLKLDPILSVAVFYALLVPLVIIVSSVSKFGFENYFLNLKAKVDKRDKLPNIEFAKND